jgi:long-chain acyl-CoA synthetase
MRVEHLLELAAQQYPARTAILYFQTHWSYGELLERVRQVAGRLAHLGVRAGDRVLFALPNCPEFVVAWFAAHWLGAEVVHGSPLYSAKELVRLARITRPRAVFTLDLKMQATLEMTREYAVPLLFVTSLAPHLPLFLRTMYRLHGLIRRPGGAGSQTAMHPFQTLYAGGLPLRSPALTDPELPAVLQPTGGTTGSPKVAVLRHRNLLANVAQLHVMSGRMPGNETVLGVLPFFHVFGATVTMLSGIAGAATLLLQAKFDPPRVLDLCLKHHPTVAPMVPFMFTSLLGEMKRRRVRLDSLRMCLSGASALDTRVREEFLTHTDAVMCEGYGLSEAAPVTHCNPPECTRAGTIGLPMPDTDVRVVDIEAGTRDVIPGQVGELVIRGPQVMKEYLNEPAETAQTLRDGWLHTGDLVVMDEGGFFRVVDRKKDMIKSAGLNVYPSEVEAVIAQCSGVQQCAVVGEDDPLWGQRVVAWVVPRPNQHIDPVLLREHCRHDLAHYKVPREFRACKELPTNFLGKVRRRELREQAGEANLPPGPEHGPKKAA